MTSSPPLHAIFSAAPYTDVTGDGVVSPIDALQVINFLNSKHTSGGGEGESIDAAFSQTDFSSSDQMGDDLLGILAADAVTSKKRI